MQARNAAKHPAERREAARGMSHPAPNVGSTEAEGPCCSRPRVALSFGSWAFEVQIDEVLAKVQRVSKTMPEARWRGSVE